MEKFITSNYEELTIDSIEIIEEDVDMYDIEVEEDHTFCITISNIISHNCNNMIKSITIPALKTDTAILILNHIYDDPSAMFTNKIKNQGGGRGIQYMGTINVQCSRLLEKDTEKDADAFHSGTNLKFFTVKNRCCRPSLETSIYLDFKHGFTNKFDGLFDEAVRYGFIQCPSQGYFTVPSCGDPEKKWRRAQIESNEEVWNTFIKQFDEKSQQDLKYSQAAKDAMEESEKEAEQQLKELE